MAQPPLSVLIHTLNEVDQIEECLRSVEFADEIYLLDSFSTDGTVELVRERFPRVRVEQRRSLGSAAQKNYGMDQVANDWVLVIDADERITPELRDEILKTLAAPALWAYSIGRRNFVLGEEIRFSGLQRDRVTRLFHRGHARYPNRRVHADLEVDGETGRLERPMIHLYARSFHHVVEKMTRYGEWGATQMFVDGKRTTARQMVVHSMWRFVRDYFFNKGYRDGIRGLILVGLHSYYTFWKYARLWEFQWLQEHGKPVPLAELDTEEGRWEKPWEKRN